MCSDSREKGTASADTHSKVPKITQDTSKRLPHLFLANRSDDQLQAALYLCPVLNHLPSCSVLLFVTLVPVKPYTLCCPSLK